MSTRGVEGAGSILLAILFIGFCAIAIGSDCDISQSCGAFCCGPGAKVTAAVLIDTKCDGVGTECTTPCPVGTTYLEAQGQISVTLGSCGARDLFVCEEYVNADTGESECYTCTTLTGVSTTTTLTAFQCTSSSIQVGHPYYYQIRVNDWTGKTGSCTSCTCTPSGSCTNCAQATMGLAQGCPVELQ